MINNIPTLTETLKDIATLANLSVTELLDATEPETAPSYCDQNDSYYRNEKAEN